MNTPTPRTDALTADIRTCQGPDAALDLCIDRFKQIEKELTDANDNLALTQGQLKDSREMLSDANAKIEDLKGLFDKYAQHLPNCSVRILGTTDYDTCGLDTDLQKVREM